MLYNGARDKTAQAMAETLGWQGLSLDEVNTKARIWLARQAAGDPQARLALANAVWIQAGLALAADFARRIRQSYGGEVASLDFGQPEAASAVINAWTAEKTEQKIREIVTAALLAGATVVLENAIYFKGLWQRPFDKALTRSQAFTLPDGSQKTVAMMAQGGEFDYYEDTQMQMVRLPYGQSKMGMLICLPRPGVELAQARQALAAGWPEYTRRLEERDGYLALPRFNAEYAVELSAPLSQLGMGIAFTSQADFSAMGAGPLFISKVIHKTFVDVNEEGTEAAAATVVVAPRGAPIKSFQMVVKRPFLCAITSEVGRLLFLGQISEP
jgi:serpin B